MVTSCTVAKVILVASWRQSPLSADSRSPNVWYLSFFCTNWTYYFWGAKSRIHDRNSQLELSLFYFLLSALCVKRLTFYASHPECRERKTSVTTFRFGKCRMLLSRATLSVTSGADRRLQVALNLVKLLLPPNSVRTYAVSAKLEKAAARLKTLREEPDNDVKLKIYALFKQVSL